MKIASFNSHNLWASHYETELEIIEGHLIKGDEVIQFYCDAQLPNCDDNPFFVPSVCNQCIDFRKQGYKLLSGNIKKNKLPTLTDSEKEIISNLPKQFNSLSEIQALELDGFDIGYCVASSLISVIRDPSPDFKKYNKTINSYITGSAAIFLTFKRWLIHNKPDLVYVFNGRLAHNKPIIRACEQVGITFNVLERGADNTKYSISVNASPHDIKFSQTQMAKAWEEADQSIRIKIATSFYQNKVKGDDVNWYSFTKEQQDVLPENWDSKKNNIVVFTSSEDEFASLSKEWQNDIYINQTSAIIKIAKDLLDDNSIHIYIRIHPNLKHANNADKEELYSLESSNLTLIPAESLISSYKLMKNADKILTFGSTVGIEASFWGKASILAGKSLYKGLGSTYEPKNHNEVIELIKSDLPALDNLGALKYGYYYMTIGIKYQFYQAEDYINGTFKGVRLVKKRLVWAIIKDWFFGNKLLKPLSDRVYYRILKKRLLNFRND